LAESTSAFLCSYLHPCHCGWLVGGRRYRRRRPPLPPPSPASATTATAAASRWYRHRRPWTPLPQPPQVAPAAVTAPGGHPCRHRPRRPPPSLPPPAAAAHVAAPNGCRSVPRFRSQSPSLPPRAAAALLPPPAVAATAIATGGRRCRCRRWRLPMSLPPPAAATVTAVPGGRRCRCPNRLSTPAHPVAAAADVNSCRCRGCLRLAGYRCLSLKPRMAAPFRGLSCHFHPRLPSPPLPWAEAAAAAVCWPAPALFCGPVLLPPRAAFPFRSAAAAVRGCHFDKRGSQSPPLAVSAAPAATDHASVCLSHFLAPPGSSSRELLRYGTRLYLG